MSFLPYLGILITQEDAGEPTTIISKTQEVEHRDISVTVENISMLYERKA